MRDNSCVLETHPYFEPWVDPVSGVLSFVLSKRIAPMQKALYYVTPSISADNRWLWFFVAFPPSFTWHLAVLALDTTDPIIRWFPQTLSGSPLVAPEGDHVWVPIEDGIYRLDTNGNVTEILRLPPDMVGHRSLSHLVVELTRSADGRHFLLDSRIGEEWLVSLAEIATGELRVLHRFDRAYFHAAFSPVDPDLFMIGQGPAYDAHTGEKTSVIDQRIWLMDRSGHMGEPLFDDLHFGRNCMWCHEWWTSQGHIQWCDYWTGIWESPATPGRQRALVWSHPGLIHGQCHPGLRYISADENCYRYNGTYPCRLWYYDRETGTEIPIVSGVAECPLPQRDHRAYHIDPHAHFSPDGSMLVHTAGMRGRVDVAITPTEGIVARLRTHGRPPGAWRVPGQTWTGRD